MREASRRAHELPDGAQGAAEIRPSQSRRDGDGRTLAYIWLNDTELINQKLTTTCPREAVTTTIVRCFAKGPGHASVAS
ncbi:hypothetical protein [Arthrobacter sp. M4]|uniref:hypothetical protein n=1 Tax=Arthrobacter sp. M4 TaxID=218160 RepID=UPI0035AC1524